MRADHLDAVSHDHSDTNAFYNYTARYLLERVALAARGWAGGPRLAIAQLGAVKGMDHGETRDYLDRVRSSNAANFDVPWEHIKWPPKWFDTYQHAGIQVADIDDGAGGQKPAFTRLGRPGAAC